MSFPKIEYKTMRHGGRLGGVDVLGWFVQPSGVLAGQTLKRFLDNYPDEAAARAAHPDVQGFSNAFSEPQVSLSHLPGPDDPVPGGMYPDDLPD